MVGESPIDEETKQKLDEFLHEEPEKVTIKLILEKECFLCGVTTKFIGIGGLITLPNNEKYPICRKCLVILDKFRAKP